MPFSQQADVRTQRVFRAALLLAFAVLPAAGLLAQPDAPLQHQSWSTDAGLPQSSVHQILQTHDGYLWLATEGGVVRYDGVLFTVFNHDTSPAFTSNDITSLAEDGQHTLWIGTADGLVARRNGTFRRYAENDGLPSASVLALAAGQDGSLVVLTTSGLVSLAGSGFHPVAGVSPDTDGMTAQPGEGVALFDGPSYVRLHQGVPSERGTSSLQLRGLLASRRGTWTWSDREVRFAAPNGQMTWSTGKELPGTRVQTVFLDRKGLAWVGTNRGLVTLDELVTLHENAAPVPVVALGVNSVLSGFEDAEGNVWIGTETSGLHALRPRKFREDAALADDEVSCVTQSSDGAVWVGTKDDGLRRLRVSGAAPDRPVANAALTSPIILALEPGPHGDLWAGTPDGLNHILSSGAVERYTSSDGMPDDLIRSLLVPADGTLWAGTRSGLAHLDGGRVSTLTQANGLGGDLIGVLFEGTADRGIWAATLGGVSRLFDGRITNYGRAEGLAGSLVSGMAQDSAGRLWLTTRDAGLFLFTGERFLPVRPLALPTELLGVLSDAKGFLWLRTRRGVVRVAANDLSDCAAAQTCPAIPAAYGMEDGMPSEEVVANGSPSGWRMRDGVLWFPTRKGVAIADPADLPLNRLPPPVVIERFLLDNETVPQSADEQKIASGHSRYTFDFAGLSFTVPSKVLYRFKLEGFDHEWSADATRRTATYTNLPSGRYVFHVQAANNDGVWNDAGAVLRFRVLPPIWRRWWFLFGLLLLVGGVVLALYRLRVRRLERSFQAVLGERNRIAREIHDTLAQDMVGISLQLDLVTQMLKGNKVPEAASQVKVTRSFVQTGIEEARQSIWNLRANTAQDSLPARVKAAAERVSSASLVVIVKMGGEYRPLDASLEAEVLRILQEALSNVQRHAEAATATVQLTYAQDTLTLVVNDNGRGFDLAEASSRSGHFGLRGLRERATSIGAALRLTSSAEGTTIELTVPLAGKRTMGRRGWRR